MPQTLGFIALAFFNAGLTGLANVFAFAQAGLLGLGAIGSTLFQVGIGLLSSLLFAPKQPKPEDVQASTRNPTANRQRHYGRMKVSGPWVFGESEKGNFWKVLALQTGEADAFEEFWVDDRIVVPNGAGLVTDSNYKSRLNIWYRLGLPTETYYPQLGAVFPEWDANHRGDGIASICIKQHAVKQETIMEMYPNMINTAYRVVGRWSKIWNPTTSTVAWSDNAADVILDYCRHADGARLPNDLFTTPQALAGWIAAHNRCAQAVTVKAGGTEPRYRLWGSYTFDERPADVLGRMMACSDSRFIPTPDGGITLEVGDWQEPTVILDEAAIVGFSDLSRGVDILSSANVIQATFLSVPHDYQATDADPWVSDDDVAARGEIPTSAAFNMAPSHGQARRLMKLAAHRSCPKWIGTFQCNLRALAAFGKRFVRIQHPLFGINEVVEVADFRFDIQDMIVRGVTLQVRSMPAEAYQWNAAMEEGAAPIAEHTEVDKTIPVPTGFSFTELRQTAGGQAYSVGVLAWDEPPSLSLQVEAQYKKVAESSWIMIPVAVESTSAQSAALDDGVQYEAQIRHVTSTGRYSNWTSPSLKMTPIANPTPPNALVTPGASGGNGVFNATFGTTNDPNLARVAIYRVPSSDALDKNLHLATKPAVAPGVSYSIPVTSTAGTYKIYMEPLNQSGVAGTLAGPFNVTVT